MTNDERLSNMIQQARAEWRCEFRQADDFITQEIERLRAELKELETLRSSTNVTNIKPKLA